MKAMRRAVRRWQRRARLLKSEVHALYLAYRDPRVPLPAKLLAVLVAGYAMSPVDLIPDFVPVLGYLDDLVLLPLGIALAVHLIPPDVLGECRKKAREERIPVSRVAAAAVILLWALLAALAIWIAWRLVRG